MKRHYTELRRRLQELSSDVIIIPLLVTLTIGFMVAMIAAVMQRSLSNSQDQAIEKQLSETELQSRVSLDNYAQLLRSGAGLASSEAVTPELWQRFTGAHNLTQSFAAMSEIGVMSYDPVDGSSRVLTYVESEHPTVVGSGSGDIVPFDESQRRAMNEAARVGDIRLSDAPTIRPGARKQDDTYLVMYAPYYSGSSFSTERERTMALRGFAYSLLRSRDVFAPIFSRVQSEKIGIRVASSVHGQSVELYRSPHFGQEKATHRMQQLTSFNQRFDIEYSFAPDALVLRQQVNAPLYTALFGTTLALLVGGVVFYYLRSRHHRLLLEKEREVTGAKDDLLSLASHQLRTPATGVKQYIGMVLQGFAGDITEQQQDFLEKAYQSNERQLRVINDILHLAKLEQGRMFLAKSEFNLTELIRDAIDEQRDASEVAKIKIAQSGLKKVVVYADNHMIRMVVENILSNAIKYTDPGGHVSVRLAREGDGYAVYVKDNGVGIDPADEPKLFRRFSRVMNARSHAVSGTGVGLYLAQHLMQLHHGSITVRSELGRGSTFTIHLPVQPEEM